MTDIAVPCKRNVYHVRHSTDSSTDLQTILDKSKYNIRDLDCEQEDFSSLHYMFRDMRPDVVLMEMMSEKPCCLLFLRELRKKYQDIPVIAVGQSNKIETVTESARLGGVDYLDWPFREEDLHLALEKIFRSPGDKGAGLPENIDEEQICAFVGPSRKIREVVDQIKLVAPTDLSIIIQGESGTGKEFVSSLIHKWSARRDSDFVAIDCGAIPETLIESELFGYERGAFTGAFSYKPGMIELADRGTIFLDEIGNLSLPSQMKLLRVLEERQVKRLGGKKYFDVDVRFVVATNVDLGSAGERSFRMDLYHRLNEYLICLPPLRDRQEDIPYLAKCFVKDSESRFKKKNIEISDDAMNVLTEYHWPGNVRELKNVITTAVLQTLSIVRPEHLKICKCHASRKSAGGDEPADSTSMTDDFYSLENCLRKAEREIIRKALTQTQGNKSQAAKILKITRPTLYKKIAIHQL